MIDFELVEALIRSLESKSDEIQRLIDALPHEMEKMPVDQRSGPRFTRRLIEVQRKQADLIRQLALAPATMRQSGRT